MKLFKFMPGSGQGSWEIISTSAALDMYDENEDAASKAPNWFLTIEGSQEEICKRIEDDFSFEPKDLRVTFAADEGVWALKFPNTRKFDSFLQQFNEKLFENQFGEDHSKAEKVSLAVVVMKDLQLCTFISAEFHLLHLHFSI